jgi:ribonucleoside-diphosphate reductase alpha chain
MSLMIESAVDMSPFAETIYKQKYAQEGEDWVATARRVVDNVMTPYFPELSEEMICAIAERKFMPGGRYLYAAGKDFHQTQNCLLMRAGDSREEWAELMHNVTSGLMTGAGVGVVYSDLREDGAVVRGMGGKSTGPMALIHMVNESGRYIMQGGARRSAIWAGLHWNHPDIFKFITAKDWSDEIKAMKDKDFNAPAPLDLTNISVILDDEFFEAMHDLNYRKTFVFGGGEAHEVTHEWAQQVYWQTVEHMLTTAEPGFSIDRGVNTGENLRNACTEITSSDDSDICNLGSINLARVDTKEEFARLVELGTAFLLAGTEYSLVPYEKVRETRTKNRRLGLGLMGGHEWLLRRGYTYDPNPELAEWMEEYVKSTEIAARYADRHGWSHPVKTRAIAPTGTIGIIAETTTSWEPLFAVAMKRRYLKGDKWHFQYVLDATAARLIQSGIDPALIETAYDLAKTPERRVRFQAWMQQFVDHAISSTINLPSVEEQNFTTKEFGDMLLGYLPDLRGITAYPDGSRGGQPLNVVSYDEAKDWVGYEYEEFGNSQACVSGSCGV